MLPIKLSANIEGWKLFSARKADPAFLKFSEKVLRRDGYTCKFCGFQAKEFQEIINLDQNYRNNKLANMVTACCFCMQCFFIESVGLGDFGGGTLIYLPEIRQNDLNSFCHVIFCAITNDTGYRSTAESIYRSLKFRSQPVEEQFGDNTSDPAVLGRLIIEASLTTDVTHTALADLRLLPSRARFKTQIERWAATALKELSSDF